MMSRVMGRVLGQALSRVSGVLRLTRPIARELNYLAPG